MSGVHETAYPRLNAELPEQELVAVFTPTAREEKFVAGEFRQAPKRTVLMIQLKLLQRLGSFIPLVEVPRPIIEHICKTLGTRPLDKRALAQYDQSGSKSLHQKLLRTFLDIKPFDVKQHGWLKGIALQASKTKQEISDIINVMIEELAHHRFELPTFAFLLRMATLARTTFNNQLYKEISDSLSEELRAKLDQLLEHRGGRSRWDRLKREPKQPGVREVTSFLQHIEELNALGEGLPVIESISVAKRTQLVIEARALDITDMRALKPAKRYALTVLLIQAQLQKAMDDIAENFIKTVRSMHHVAEERLRQYKLDHADQTERLIGQFRDMLTAFHLEGTQPERLARIERVLDGDPE